MIVEEFKAGCLAIGWNFKYGPEHWQNLSDFPEDGELPFAARQKHFLLLWKDREDILNSFGETEGYVYDGEFVLSVRSKISDKDYEYKYETHIKNLEDEVDLMKTHFSLCDDWTLQQWRLTEVENQLDTNLDGLKVKFKIKIDL